ncbi:MAG: pantoate--beta-alanine ligase [Flavobacteriales bacterium]|nr:pantoate--beta-alanine ligase [Flavobacteriales bacterium]
MLKLVTTVEEMKEISKKLRSTGKTIGFVPTMGYLHEGHLSLIKRAKSENDVVIVSIFVNPIQFGVNEDYDVYPRDIKRDTELCEVEGVAYIFHPTVKEMYPNGYQSFVEVMEITNKLCGASRPGHFKGVTTVVTKLFNITMAHRAYFGWKDAQQVMVIQRMVKDLNMNIEVIACPILREIDGLAMSSRNVNLSVEDRRAALVLSRSLFEAKDRISNGEVNPKEIIDLIKTRISEEPSIKIDYVEAVDLNTMQDAYDFNNKSLIALAVRAGKVRLIDNIIVGEI